MAGVEEGKQKRLDGQQHTETGGPEEQTASTTVAATLKASNPALYAAPGKKFEVPFQVQAITPYVEKFFQQSTGIQKLIETTDRLLRPSAAVHAVIEAAQKSLRPSREIQALSATDLTFLPSLESYAAIAAMEQTLWPSREMKQLAAWTEEFVRPSAQQRAAFEAMDKILQPSESLKAMFAVMDTHRSTASLSSILGGLETLNTSAFFNLLKSTDLTKLHSLIDTFESEESFSDLPAINPISKDVEAEIVQALKDTNGPQKLTAPAVAFLLLFIAAVHTFYEDISKWNDFRESVCDMQQRLGAFESLAQARKLVRGALCDVPAALTQSFRLTKKDGINLREEPGMKAEVIMTLPKFAPLEVIDSTNRDWLLVSYKHEGLEIEGWVSRKFVRPASR